MIHELTGVVLAGGSSRRFGSNKAFIDWQGTALVEAVARSLRRLMPKVLVAAKDPGAMGFIRSEGVEVIADLSDEQHPLGGIHSSLGRLETRYAFVCACDMPLVQPGLIESLWEARADYAAVIPVWNGARQPLCGIYSTDCAGVIRCSLQDPSLGVNSIFDSVRTRFLLEPEIRQVDPRGLSFMDIDTRGDLRRAKRMLRC